MIRGSAFSAILHGLLLGLLLFGLPHIMLLIEGDPAPDARSEPPQLEVTPLTPELAERLDRARSSGDAAKADSGKRQGLLADALNTETDEEKRNKLQSAVSSSDIVQPAIEKRDGQTDRPDQTGREAERPSESAISASRATSPSQQTPNDAADARQAVSESPPRDSTSAQAESPTAPQQPPSAPMESATTAPRTPTSLPSPQAGAVAVELTPLEQTERTPSAETAMQSAVPLTIEQAAGERSLSASQPAAAEEPPAQPSGRPLSGAAALAVGDDAARAVQPLVAALPRLDETVGEILAAQHRDPAQAVSAAQASPALQQTIVRMRQAAEQGYAHAQFTLAEILLTGDGEPRDVERGLQYLQRASLNGYVPAQLLTAALAIEGSVLQRDLAEAHAWLEAAAEQGNRQAQETLPRLERQMDPRESVRARQRRSQLRQVFVLSNPKPDERLQQPQREDQLRIATTLGDVEAVYLLLSQGADANKPDGAGRTATIEAAWRGYGKILNALLEQGADARGADETGKTALMWAAINGHTDVARLLVGTEAPIDVQDREGMTALMRAAWNGHGGVVELLLENRANPRLRDRTGKTALDYAVQGGRAETVQLLQAALRR